MKIEYTVHSATREPVAVTARLGDRDVKATVPGLTVELTSPDMGHTFRLVPESDEAMTAALELFAVGAPIVLTFTPGVVA